MKAEFAISVGDTQHAIEVDGVLYISTLENKLYKLALNLENGNWILTNLTDLLERGPITSLSYKDELLQVKVGEAKNSAVHTISLTT